MTTCIVSLALILAPTPLAEHPTPKEPTWPISLPTALAAVSTATMSPWSIEEDWPMPPSSSAPIESDAVIVTPSPPIALAPIEQGMNRLAERDASPYELRVFGCLAWFESRNDTYAISVTNDRGLWQIHFPLHAWRFAGRDWRDPIANADVAMDIYRESGFRAWATWRMCV